MSKFDQINPDQFYFGFCKLHSEQKKIIYKNPHCAEFFCTGRNVFNCTGCSNYLKNKNIMVTNKKNIQNQEEKPLEYCKTSCSNGLIYDFVGEDWDINNNPDSKIDPFKKIQNFYQDKLIHYLDEIPYLINFEPTLPRPKSVVHWGQLKMFLVTLLFLIKKVNPTDEEVHIIYPGSARGDNILILCQMFPNTRWYLIDPLPFHPKLRTHNQIIQIKNEYFTDKTAQYYADKFANRTHPLFLLSDIRVNTDDKSVIDNQESNVKWHNMIKPDYSYFKFRCPYNGPDTYDYYAGKIYIQPFAPVSSSESRILFDKVISKKTYNLNEYMGKFAYFNRVLRPGYYRKRIIPENKYFDRCYDCTYYSYIISNYLKIFAKFNPFGTQDILAIMNQITKRIGELTLDRIQYQNKLVRKNLI